MRQIEIGLASLTTLTFGLTTAIFSVAILQSVRYPKWFGTTGLLGAIAAVAAGGAQATTGFSELAMLLGMFASFVLLVWFILAGILIWRLSR